MSRQIVHVTANAGDMYTFHDIVAGDYKISRFAALLAAFYTPLRLVERGGWHLVKPLGTSYP